MKIGIMSMQRITNYGSFLQAFALSKTIKNLGHDVQFVDFKVEPCITQTETSIDVSKLSKYDQDNLQKARNFYSFFAKEYLKELDILERNERAKVDTLVIGSDEVFNCLQDNPEVGYSLELFGKNNNAKKVISYAASCGNTTFEKLVSFNKVSEISNLLSKFQKISVRDKNSKDFVNKLIGKEPQQNLDPVLIYNFDKDKKTINIDFENYIILYAYNLRFTKQECDAIKKFANKHNKKIISLGSYQYCTDLFIPAHPLEVFSYFEKADFIITDTFHGTIFSVKTHKPFATFIRESNKEKLSDLLFKLNLSDRQVKDLNNLENILLTPINYEKTDFILENEKESAIQYLKENLN